MNCAEILGVVLAAHTLLSGVLTSLVALVLRPWIRQARPTHQAVVWALMFALAAGAPFALHVVVPSASVPSAVERPPSADALPQVGRASSTAEPTPSSSPSVPDPASATPGAKPSAVPKEPRASLPSAPALPFQLPTGPWAWGVVLVWLGGAGMGLVRVGRGVVRWWGIKQRSSSCERPVVHQALALAGGVRKARVLVSEELGVPVAVGWLRPAVIVPKFLAAQARDADLLFLLLHELAHLRRGDDWAKLVQQVVRAVLFFSPALYVIGREWEKSRELACDAWVVARVKGAAAYAEALVRLGRMAWQAGPVHLARLTLPSSLWQRRVEMLRSWNNIRWKPVWLVGPILAAFAVGLWALPPLWVVGPVPWEGRIAQAAEAWVQVPYPPEQPFTWAALGGHSSYPQRVTFSPDGRLLAVAEQGNFVQLWDTATWKVVRTLLAESPSLAPSVAYPARRGALAFSPDGRWLAAPMSEFHEERALQGSYPQQRDVIAVWDVESGERVATLDSDAISLAFSPDGRHLASMAWPPQEVRIWDVSTWQWVRAVRLEILPPETVVPLPSLGMELHFSPDGRWLVVGALGFEEPLTFIEVGSWQVGRMFPVGVPVHDFALSPDGAYVAVVSPGRVRVFDVETGNVLLDTPAGGGPVAFLSSQVLVALGPEGRLQAWTVPSGEVLWTLPARAVQTLAIHPHKPFLATATGLDYNVTVWDFTRLEPVATLHGVAPGGPVAAAPYGPWIALGAGARVLVWRHPDHRPLFDLRFPGLVGSLDFSPTEDLLAVGLNSASRPEVHLWDLSTGYARVLSGHTAEIQVVRFSPDGTLLASGDAQGAVHVWDVAQGTTLRRVVPSGPRVLDLDFSPDGALLAVTTRAEPVVQLELGVWEVATGRLVGRWPNCGGQVRFLTNDVLVTLAVDTTDGGVATVLWDLHTGQARERLGPYTELALDPQRRFLAVVERTVWPRKWLVWDLASGRVVRELPWTPYPGSAAWGLHGTVLFVTSFEFASPAPWGSLGGFYLGDLR